MRFSTVRICSSDNPKISAAHHPNQDKKFHNTPPNSRDATAKTTVQDTRPPFKDSGPSWIFGTHHTYLLLLIVTLLWVPLESLTQIHIITVIIISLLSGVCWPLIFFFKKKAQPRKLLPLPFGPRVGQRAAGNGLLNCTLEANEQSFIILAPWILSY